jgi:hypothetical protein
MPLDLRPDFGADHGAHHEVDSCTGRAGHNADIRREPGLQLAQRLAEIDRVLDRAPGPIRYRPLRRAVWRALLLPVGDVLWMYRRQLDGAGLTGKPDGDSDALQAMAYALVARAILGDASASSLLFDIIEGRPERRRSDARASPCVRGTRSTAADLNPVERARMIVLLEAALGKASIGEPGRFKR